MCHKDDGTRSHGTLHHQNTPGHASRMWLKNECTHMDALTEVGDEDDRRRYADEKEAVRLAGEIAADDGANDEAHA